VDIKDNGIGINKENHADIFDSFTQENNTYSRDYGGAGLGLAISKKLAVLLGGDLRLVNSRKNKGSHFQLEVSAPVIQVIEQISQSSTEDSEINRTKEKLVAKPTIKSLNNTLTGKKILLAEDSKENQILFKIFIESTGALLTIVSNGEDAVHELENGDYDLGILDIQMPLLDGHNAVSQVRSLGIKLPIFALTAHTLKGEKEKSLKHGFDDFLTKPVKKEELIETIKKHIFKC
jgi:CheY-like chemotaxis protein